MRWNTYIARKLLSGGYGMLYNWFCTQQQPSVEYGYLYNRHATSDSRNICSVGWHVGTRDDYNTLMRYIDPSGTYNNNVAGGKIKESGITHWTTPNTGATNEFLFNGRAGGQRSADGTYSNISGILFLWNATNRDDTTAYHSYLSYNSGVFFTSYLSGYNTDKKTGHSLDIQSQAAET